VKKGLKAKDGEIVNQLIKDFPQLKPDTIRKYLDSKFKDKEKAKAGKISAETKDSVGLSPTDTEPDPYADIRKFSKFNNPEELVTYIV